MSNNKKNSRLSQHTPTLQTEQTAYEVSYEVKTEQAVLNLPEAIRQELEQLHDQIHKQAKQAIPRLLELQKLYPKVMLINNFLSVAYGYTDGVKQKQCITENYQNNKQYLFARCHYAKLCLQQGETAKIPQIFEHKFDLKAQYPRRSRFHITEYLAYMEVLCLYLHAIDEQEQSEKIFANMQKAAPNSAEVKQCDKALHPGAVKRFFAKFSKQ